MERESETKFLGVIIEETLKWNKHIQYIQKKICKQSIILYHVRSKLDIKAMWNIYYALVYSVLFYCNTIWGNAGTSIVKPLFIAQKRVVRTIMSM